MSMSVSEIQTRLHNINLHLVRFENNMWDIVHIENKNLAVARLKNLSEVEAFLEGYLCCAMKIQSAIQDIIGE